MLGELSILVTNARTTGGGPLQIARGTGSTTRRAGRPKLRPEEQWARVMIAQALECRVEQHDDGSSPSMHDLDIIHADKRVAAVEVTAAADRRLIELWKLMNPPGERWLENGLRGGWMVVLDPSARARRLRRELPGLLRQLEGANVRELRNSWRRDGPFDALAHELRIVGASQSGTDFEGSIYITVELPDEQSGGFVADTSDAVVDWVGTYLGESSQTDVLEKLTRSGQDDRHAFVLVPGFSTAPFAVSDPLMRDDSPAPTCDPRLPEAVTHVWVASTWSSGFGFRWSPDNGWTKFSKNCQTLAA